MSLRWRLNISFLALIAVFLAAAWMTIRTVRDSAEQTRLYASARELSQFTADLRTHIYQQLSRAATGSRPADETDEPWPTSALDDVDIQIRQSLDEGEKMLWERVRGELVALAQASRTRREDIPPLLRQAEQDLRELRNYYDGFEYRSMKETANGSFQAQTAISLACMLTVLLFLTYLMIVRRWLVQPIQVLRNAADTIGQGRLEHRVPLKGSDELSQLARSIDAMAEGLARYQADLVRSRELSALGELCANVAHGLRNPLAAIRSTAQLAERRSDTEDEREVFRELSAQADRMDHRITSLFQFSRPVDLQYRAANFREIVESGRAQALPLLKTRNVSVSTEDATGGQAFEVDSEQLAQAVGELLTNAAHHSQNGSGILVRGEVNRSEGGAILTILVQDHGSGMSPATLHKAFDLFFTSRPEGTGIGLPLVRRIMERHGGEVDITSESGHGTTVTLRVPSHRSGNGHAPRTQLTPSGDGVPQTGASNPGIPVQ